MIRRGNRCGAMRRGASGDESDLIKAQRMSYFRGEPQVTVVDRIECAAENSEKPRDAAHQVSGVSA